MASYPNPTGPAPKPASKRRRYTKPASYGSASPTAAPAAAHEDARKLGFDAHPLITQMWNTVQTACESAFFSETGRHRGDAAEGRCG
jgi:hypothetical protein